MKRKNVTQQCCISLDAKRIELLLIMRVIKSRRMRWAGHVALVGEEWGVYRVLVGKPEGKNHWGDLGIDG